MAQAAVLGGERAVRRWVAGSGQSGLRVAVFLLAPFVFVLALGPFLPDWLRIIPQAWSAPFVGWINAAVEFLRREEILGLLTFRDFTRAIADPIDYPLDFVEAILVAGFSDSIPGLPWIAVTGLAIVIYATIPTTRLTIFGLRTVPLDIVEAAITSGCTPRQVLWKVRMPLAFPAIMLGINQTIMYALFMVVIAAFIGTTDLGHEIFRSKADIDAGKSLVVGLCIAFMG